MYSEKYKNNALLNMSIYIYFYIESIIIMHNPNFLQ